MANSMKPVTIYFQEIQYLMYQQLAQKESCKTAELIRRAMSEYLEKRQVKSSNLDEWEPVSLGGLKNGGDWIDKGYQDEMLGEAF